MVRQHGTHLGPAPCGGSGRIFHANAARNAAWLQKLDAERLEAVAAAEAYADRVSEAERKNAEMASKSGINPIIVARENKVPPKRRTLMDVDVVGTKWAVDSQAGRFVA